MLNINTLKNGIVVMLRRAVIKFTFTPQKKTIVSVFIMVIYCIPL